VRGGTGGKFLAGTGGRARAAPLLETGAGGGGNDGWFRLGGVSVAAGGLIGAAVATRVTWRSGTVGNSGTGDGAVIGGVTTGANGTAGTFRLGTGGKGRGATGGGGTGGWAAAVLFALLACSFCSLCSF